MMTKLELKDRLAPILLKPIGEHTKDEVFAIYDEAHASGLTPAEVARMAAEIMDEVLPVGLSAVKEIDKVITELDLS